MVKSKKKSKSQKKSKKIHVQYKHYKKFKNFKEFIEWIEPYMKFLQMLFLIPTAYNWFKTLKNTKINIKFPEKTISSILSFYEKNDNKSIKPIN